MRTVTLDDLVGIMGIQSLHPGALEMTREFSELMGFSKEQHLLEVASGSGETANWITGKYGCKITGIDFSHDMINFATKKAMKNGFTENLNFLQSDAHSLPFEGTTFDAAFSEAAVSMFDVKKVISEMTRVVKPGGKVGIHDMYWMKEPGKENRKQFYNFEGFDPMFLEQWVEIFKQCGLEIVHVEEKLDVMDTFYEDSTRDMGYQQGFMGASKLLVKYGVSALKELYNELQVAKTDIRDYIKYFVLIGKKAGE